MGKTLKKTFLTRVSKMPTDEVEDEPASKPIQPATPSTALPLPASTSKPLQPVTLSSTPVSLLLPAKESMDEETKNKGVRGRKGRGPGKVAATVSVSKPLQPVTPSSTINNQPINIKMMNFQ